ncbi:MAG TPA: hypothetical protein VGV90_05395 [Solirubrobacteraceae bacterium]|nr:hypothetical protein [Solirubrobacteraceae bacterium]
MNATTMQTETTITAAKIRADLRLLYAERALADLEGMGADPTYMDDLLDDISSLKEAYVGAVVTEIATLRAELGGALQG